MAAEEHADINALEAALDAVEEDARNLIAGLTPAWNVQKALLS